MRTLLWEGRRLGEGSYRLRRGHWEVLELEDTQRKLLSATDIPRSAFDEALRSKLEPLP